jgi:hypothetical protein
MKSFLVIVTTWVGVVAGTARAERVFYDDFQTFGAPWTTYGCTGTPLGCQFGPIKFETWPHEWNHSPDCVNPPGCDPRGESGPECPCTSARQYEHSQAWLSWQLRQPPVFPGNRGVKYSVWFLDLLYRTDRHQVIFSHFQVQGWVSILDAAEIDYAILGIHAHWTNPDANWLNYSWATASDGWHVTSIPRTYGWRHFEIVVHPYTGNVGDVEFFIDGQKAGEGQRYAIDGAVWPPGNVRIGADPSFMEEDYVANTYQNTYYDDAEVFLQDKGDFDFDGDVDLADFGHFQGCFNGPNRPPAAEQCADADLDQDNDVDLADFGVFQGCFNGPNRPPASGCND